MKAWGLILVSFLTACGGEAFSGGGVSMVTDAASEASEVDAGPVPTDTRADMFAEGEASVTIEASSDAGADVGNDVPTVTDGGDGGEGPPTCGDDEVYPQDSPTCRNWITTTAWPLDRGCCRKETHTCGHIVSFSPFCVKLGP